MTAFTPTNSRPWSRHSEVDAPCSFSPPSPVLSASPSWTSCEIPIFLASSRSTDTLRLSVANSTSSLFPHVETFNTFGLPVRKSTGITSRLSCISGCSSSNSSMSTTASCSVVERGEGDSYEAHQGSAASLSEYLASTSLHIDAVGSVRRSHRVMQQNVSDMKSCASSFGSLGKRERRRTLNDLVHPDLAVIQSQRGFNLEPHVLLSQTSSFSLSPATLAASTHTTNFAEPTRQQQYSRAVPTTLIRPSTGVIDTVPESCNAQPQQHPSPSPSRPRSNSDPYLPVPVEFLQGVPAAKMNVPDWLRGVWVELWIDQEGFRAIQPRLELASFSHGAGVNTSGEILDVAEFVMRTRRTWYFHYAPLDRAPVLRRLTVNGGMNDYISRQAALTLKENGVYVVESTEDKGRIAWKFEYCVEGRRAPESGKVMDGEKRFTPLRFVCNPTLLSAEHGKKIKLLQFMRKSVTPKLQSTRFDRRTRANTVFVPRIVVPEEHSMVPH